MAITVKISLKDKQGSNGKIYLSSPNSISHPRIAALILKLENFLKLKSKL